MCPWYSGCARGEVDGPVVERMDVVEGPVVYGVVDGPVV